MAIPLTRSSEVRLAFMNGFMIEDMEDFHRFRAWLGQQPVPRLVDWLVEAGVAHRPLLIALNAEWGSGADGGWDPGPVREAIRRLWASDARFVPEKPLGQVRRELSAWADAVRRTRSPRRTSAGT